MSNNISSEWKLAKFTLPSNSFYGNSTFNSFAIPASDWKSSKTTTFTQSSSRTVVEETFLKKFGPVRRSSTGSSHPLIGKNMEESRSRSNRSLSPDWATCRFSLPTKTKVLHQNKDRKSRKGSISRENNEESKKENRSVSPDWTTSRFSLPPLAPKRRSTSTSPKIKKPALIASRNSRSLSSRNRSVSPDWNTSRFSLPKLPNESQKMIHKKVAAISLRITSPLGRKHKTKINRNTMYTISQKTLDKLLPKPEVHLFDVVKYGPLPQHKDDFLFGLNLMRSEVLNKIDLLHYKKKLRNTGINFIRTFQQPKKSRSRTSKSDASSTSEKVEGPIASIEIPDKPEETTIDVDTSSELNTSDEIDKPEGVEVIQIDDDDEDAESEKLLEEAIQDFADKFGSEDIIEETTEKSNVIGSNIGNSILNSVNGKETVKISETNTFYHSVTKKRHSLDSEPNSKTSNNRYKRNSLPNIKSLKRNGVIKKKPSSNKKKNIIKIKWPIARKSLLELRNNS